MAEFWATVAQQIGGGSRTDVLRALIWPNALILIALVWSATKGAPLFLLILLSALLVAFMLLYAGAYVLFGIKDPNLLRSERYNIEKMAIEQGLLGDSLSGLRKIEGTILEVEKVDATPMIGRKND